MADTRLILESQDIQPGRDTGSGTQGGAAAIYGFLHQITLSIRQLLHAQFGKTAGKLDPATITAIFEPTAGGDISIETPAREVSQIKHRARAVSIADMSAKILPDLYRAHCDKQAACYSLHTTNGVSKPAFALIDACKRWAEGTSDQPAPPVALHLAAAIANCTVIHTAAGNRSTFRDNFALLIERFVVIPPVGADHARQEVERWLATRLAYGNQGEASLDQLVGFLFNQAQASNAVISVDDLLARLGLPGSHDGHPDAAAARLASGLVRSLKTREFEPSRDVRDAVTVSAADPFTLVTGASGCGKSWVLYRVASGCAQAKRPAVLVRAATLADLRVQLTQTIAIEALHQEQPIEPMLLGQTWRRMRDDPDAVLTILWEGCRDVAALEDIRLAGGLGPGLVLVAEFPVGETERLIEFKAVPTHHVGEFTPLQLFEALKRRGVAAGHVPQSIRRMLLLPVLCGIYATLALELDHWNPQSEYRVLADFWQRARRVAGKFAGTRLKGLARAMVAARRSAISDDGVHGLGLAETDLLALTGAGWLTSDSGSWSFAHDRLMSWAVAEALAGDFIDGGIDATGLAERVIALQQREAEEKTTFPNLGFVLMDVVWLIGDQPQRAVEIATFLQAFEPEHLTSAHTLYGELLPTAGSRMQSALVERARRIVDPIDLVEAHLISAFRRLKLDQAGQTRLLATLWGADTGAGRSIAISLGARWPMRAERDLLWNHYCALSADRETGEFDYELFQRMENALKTVVRDDPLWLGARIAAEEGQEELRLAAYLLKSLDGPTGGPVWVAAKEKLFARIPEDRHTVLAECIGRFGDRSALTVLIGLIRSRHRASPVALDILIALDPAEACALIETSPRSAVTPRGSLWLHRLLDFDAARASRAVRFWLLKHDPSGRELARAWGQAEERIDPETIDCLVDRLDEVLAKPPEKTPPDPLRTLLGLLGSLTLDPVNDGVFQARQGTRLAAALRLRAIAHFDAEKDEHYVAVRRLLRRIGGSDYEALILHALSPDDIALAHTGIISAIFAPSPAVVDRLTWLAGNGTHSGKDDGPLLSLWRVLLALDPDSWRPRLVALLASDVEFDILLGLTLLPEYLEEGDHAHILACLAKSAPASVVEAKAMNVAATTGDPDALAVRRAVARLADKESDTGQLGALNVLLADRSAEGRAALDAHLAPLETIKSWKSFDADALAIRLRQGDASEALWRAGERMISRPFLSGSEIIDVIAERDPPKAMNVLLERAFAPPGFVTNTQPEAIRELALLDKPLATQAFVQAWVDHETRRQYLAPSARHLDDEALKVMVDHLAEDDQHGGGTIAYRATCIELRHARERAGPLLRERFARASAADRLALCEAIGWLPGSPQLLADIVANDPDSDVRDRAHEIRRQWILTERAVGQLRAVRTLDAMEYVIDIADPTPLCAWGDPLRIIEDIQPDPRLTAFAETQLARRFNAVRKSSNKRIPVRNRLQRAMSNT